MLQKLVRFSDGLDTANLLRSVVSGIASQKIGKLQALDPRAVKWCALGTIQKAYPASQWAEAKDRLSRALSVSDQGLAQMTKSDKACSLMEWNDNRRCSFAEVKEICYRLISK